MITKTDAKNEALHVLKLAIGEANYKIENLDYSDEEKEQISEYLNELAVKACKAVKINYVSY